MRPATPRRCLALAACARTRRSIVSSPLSITHAVNGRHRAAGVFHVGFNRLANELSAAKDHPAQGPALPVNVFGRGIDHHIRPLRDGVGIHRCGKDIVDHHQRPLCMGEFGQPILYQSLPASGWTCDSKNTALVSGAHGRRHCARSVPSTKLTSTP